MATKPVLAIHYIKPWQPNVLKNRPCEQRQLKAWRRSCRGSSSKHPILECRRPLPQTWRVSLPNGDGATISDVSCRRRSRCTEQSSISLTSHCVVLPRKLNSTVAVLGCDLSFSATAMLPRRWKIVVNSQTGGAGQISGPRASADRPHSHSGIFFRCRRIFGPAVGCISGTSLCTASRRSSNNCNTLKARHNFGTGGSVALRVCLIAVSSRQNRPLFSFVRLGMVTRGPAQKVNQFNGPSLENCREIP